MSDNKEVKEMLVKLDNKLDRVEITLEKQGVELQYHIKRTNLLEDQINPIRLTHQQVIGIFKFIGWLGVLAALASGLQNLIILFKNG